MLLDTGNSAKPFSFTHGYAEARMQIPKGQGIWPAFWMVPLNSVNASASDGEIDIFEGQGNIPNVDTATFHWGGPQQSIGSNINAGGDLSQAFHTYGVDWEPDHITWYLDGIAIQTVTSAQAAITSVPMFLILDVWLGGWNGEPDSTTPFPATMNIDWVHVWQTGAAPAVAAVMPAGQSNQSGMVFTASRIGSAMASLSV
jgi:beta-glucanase (GH16 family)